MTGRPLIELSEVTLRDAIDKTHSYMDAARYLHISYNTFKKVAKSYGIFECGGKNRSGKGTVKFRGFSRERFKATLEGKYNGKKMNTTRFRDQIIAELMVEEKCSICGLNEKRIVDGRTPLLLGFNDGDKTNYKLENLTLICYNCNFYTVGNLTGKKREYLYDPYTGEIIQEIKLKK